MQDGSSNFPCAMSFTGLHNWVQCFTFPALVSDTTEVAFTGLSFLTRGIRKSFSLHLGRLGYHITKAERDGKASFSSAFPLSASEMHLLQDVCSAGWRISLVELKRKKYQKCKLIFLYFWFTVGIGEGVRKNTTENVPWLCVKKKKQWGCCRL